MSEFNLPKSACLVVFDDDMGVCATMGWDEECQPMTRPLFREQPWRAPA